MKIVFATNNQNKVKEVQAQLPEHIQIISLKEIECLEDIPETQDTIEGNALQKANYVFENYGVACFADDTGLEVAELDGAPGVFSARYAGPEKDSEKNMQKLLTNLEAQNNRSAQFKTVIALVGLNETRTFEGVCKGNITNEKQGDRGFGYDPIFQPKGHDKTFAQMPIELKNQIGHRGKAVKQLIDFLGKIN